MTLTFFFKFTKCLKKSLESLKINFYKVDEVFGQT